MEKQSDSKREHLVETAQKLFYQQGIRSTGIDAVLAESGVAKRTLYKHFRSKDELVIAALQRRDSEFMQMIKLGVPRYLDTQQGDPRLNKILAYFDAIEEWLNSDRFYGCMFINASAEYPRQSDPVHVVCANHKKLVIQYIEQLISELPLDDAQGMAVQLALLTDGAIVNAHTTNIPGAGLVAKETAKNLLSASLKQSSEAV